MTIDLRTSEFLLLFRGTDWQSGLSDEALRAAMAEWLAWREDLRQQGRVKAAQPLLPEGKVVAGRKGRLVADGPFAESKEAIGGYLLIEAGSEAEAIEVARSWPMLQHGASVEVRPVASECPVFAPLRREVARESRAPASA
jgi:hypothetical protein